MHAAQWLLLAKADLDLLSVSTSELMLNDFSVVLSSTMRVRFKSGHSACVNAIAKPISEDAGFNHCSIAKSAGHSDDALPTLRCLP